MIGEHGKHLKDMMEVNHGFKNAHTFIQSICVQWCTGAE